MTSKRMTVSLSLMNVKAAGLTEIRCTTEMMPCCQLTCYNCDIRGHLGRVCKKPSKSHNGQKMVRVAETRGRSRSISHDERRQGLSTQRRNPIYVRYVPGHKMYDDIDIRRRSGPPRYDRGHTFPRKGHSDKWPET